MLSSRSLCGLEFCTSWDLLKTNLRISLWWTKTLWVQYSCTLTINKPQPYSPDGRHLSWRRFRFMGSTYCLIWSVWSLTISFPNRLIQSWSTFWVFTLILREEVHVWKLCWIVQSMITLNLNSQKKELLTFCLTLSKTHQRILLNFENWVLTYLLTFVRESDKTKRSWDEKVESNWSRITLPSMLNQQTESTKVVM